MLLTFMRIFLSIHLQTRAFSIHPGLLTRLHREIIYNCDSGRASHQQVRYRDQYRLFIITAQLTSGKKTMAQELIIYPVIALVTLTFGIVLWMAKLRFRASIRGDIDPRYFKLNRGYEVPEYLAKVTQNYDNLVEMPILFYTVCCLLYASGQVELAQLILAWLYVSSRFIHSYIHTTSNRLLLRLKVFAFGATILIAMWLLFLFRLLQT